MNFSQMIIAKAGNNPSLHPYVSTLETWNQWLKVDFVFAYDSLPFISARSFKPILKKATASVKPNGIFAVSLFGMDDEWVAAQKANGISVDDVKALLTDFTILHFEVIKKVGQTVFEGEKMWHIIEVIARRNKL